MVLSTLSQSLYLVTWLYISNQTPFHTIANVQFNCRLEQFFFLKMDQHTMRKWLIHAMKEYEENRSQNMKHQ